MKASGIIFWLCSVGAFTLIVSACSPTRRLKQDEKLLTRIHIQNNQTHVDESTLRSYISQKTNRKVLGARLYLQIYNLVDADKEAVKQAARVEKRKRENEIRKQKGKKLKSETPKNWRQFLLDIGEAPTLYNASETERVKRQLHLLLINKGYFQNAIKDSLVAKGRRKTEIYYLIKPGKPYIISEVKLNTSNEAIRKILLDNQKRMITQPGKIYDRDHLNHDRDNIVLLLKNAGYFDFNPSAVSFVADTGFGNHTVALQVNIANKQSRQNDSIVSEPHKPFKIRKISVDLNYQFRGTNTAEQDTASYKHVHFLNVQDDGRKMGIISQALLICPDQHYNKLAVDRSYQNLSNLRQFRFINILFEPVSSDSLNQLDCMVQLSPLNPKAINYETQGTNTQGNLGMAFDVSFQNRNFMKTADILEFRLFTALESQRILNNVEDQRIISFLPFNTFQIGPEISLTLPRLWPFKTDESCKDNRSIPQTKISSSFSFQNRPDYKRTILNLNMSYRKRSKNPALTHVINPFDINFVSVSLSDAFRQQIEQLNSLFYKNSFSDQLILAVRYNLLVNLFNRPGKPKTQHYWNFGVESSGFVPSLIGQVYAYNTNAAGQNLLLQVPYAQFIKSDVDYRFLKALNPNADIAIRGFAGVGIPYGNSRSMPFVKSYSGGGTNDIRAWIARSLGPGGFTQEAGQRLEQIADLKALGSIEYRYKLYKMFETAAFIDAGNIWMRLSDESRPDAEFRFDRFYRQIAMGGGAGVRLNFNYFIFRLDAAHPFFDPSLPLGERWEFDKMQIKKVNLNFGIGYPF